ncbi:MAG: hypothetical protein F4X44_10075 [Gammaproteobacteria bacterium]|nr:hypothetical protein [Gammaproteobacteria bacterium]MYD80945.1 hypothetical protein [Gammaproteobacteria bacterium]
MVNSEKHNRRGAGISGWRRWFVLAFATVLLGFFVAYYFWPNDDTPVGETATQETHPAESVAQDPTHQRFPPRKLRQAWYETSAKDATLIPRPENLPGDSRYVTLPGEFDQWLLGTPVEISIPHTGKRYRSIVDRIAPDGLGNTTIYAKPDADEEEFHHLIVTYSSAQTLAYVSTTLGSYELTGSEKGGWITSTNSLQERRDYSQKDVMETQRDRHATTKYVPPRED